MRDPGPRSDGGEIYTVSADGTSEARLTNNLFRDEFPAWSPDGSMIAFDTLRTSNYEIYTMSADGNNQVNRTNDPADDIDPAWSPDGAKIAFETFRAGNFEIYTMNADGTNQVNRSSNASQDERPDWGPQSYTSPVGASPLRVSLVPAFEPCEAGAANSQHGAPLAFPSCHPPALASTTTKFGPDSIGFFRIVVCPVGAASGFCNPTPAGRMPLPDLRFTGSLRNVQCASAGTPGCTAAGDPYDPDTRLQPYTDGGNGTGPAQPFCEPDATSESACVSGTDLTMVPMIGGGSGGARVTSRFNCDQTGSGPPCPATTTSNWPATTKDLAMFPIGIPLSCRPQGTAGCGVNTTANALVPGSVIAGQAEVVQLGEIRVLDSGPNGIRGDSDDQVLATQGVFAP